MRAWPDGLDAAGIMAKSADQSHKGGSAQQTLSEHTFQVLERLSDQVRLHPRLPTLLGDPYLWDRLYWGCFLHDFGKAAQGFQERLKPKAPDNQWSANKHRHEALSLGFVDWLFPTSHPDRGHVIAVITCHHKDAATILGHYQAHKEWRDLTAEERDGDRGAKDNSRFLASQISPAVRYQLWRWAADCGVTWAADLGIPLSRIPQLTDWETAEKTDLAQSLYKALRHFQHWQEKITPEDRTVVHVYRGLILTSDHAASSGAQAFPDFHFTRDHAMRPLSGKSIMPHQRASSDAAEGSLLLVAPTGAGKTEAAMLWAAQQKSLRSVSRLFYTLPYQASMNAAAIRLSEGFFGAPFDEHQYTVTLQHSRATLRFYQDRMEADEDTKSATRVALERRNKTGLNYFPVQVFSPYQMLKAAYSLKGYETFLLDYADALFIFDEIHAYEAKRMALIIPFMGWLARHYRSRFLIMTATLPPMVETLLKEALPGLQKITADDQTFAASRRHKVMLLDGAIDTCTDAIIERYQRGESVLVCCNTVQCAQEMYDALANRVPKWLPGDDDVSGDLCLLHGRFHLKDRTAKEKWLLRRVGVRENPQQSRRPVVMVATQVVEVSLNVDFDTLFTAPAPLEALLQRFGRVNRGRGKDAPLHEVYVCRSPVSETECKPYDYRLVARALEVLPEGAIDEAQVSALLAQIYDGELGDEWLLEYRNAAKDFESVILAQMQPFESATDGREKLFYRNFEGQQVLPAPCADDYEIAFEKGRLASSEYLVNVTNRQFWALKPRLYDETRKDRIYVVDALYDAEYGLRFAPAPGEDDV